MVVDPWNKKLCKQRIKSLAQEFGKEALEIHFPVLWGDIDPKGFNIQYSTVSTIQIRVPSVGLILMMEAPEHARH